jgi:hypothetical protein
MEPPSSLTLATPRGGRPLTDRQSRSVAGNWAGDLRHQAQDAPRTMEH